MTPPIPIVGVGMACPVGWHSASALAALRAGVTRFTEVGDIIGPGGPARASRLAALDPAATRSERAAAFARPALHEALAHLGDPGERPLPCFLATPEPDLGPPLDLAALLRDLADAAPPLRLELHRGESGRAGCFAALRAATRRLLAPGEDRFALVGGLDSLADPQTLAALADRDRLLGRSNLDGVLPGEGAAFLLLMRPTAPAPRAPLARLLATAVAREPLPFAEAGDRLSAADGLTAAFHQLRDGFAGHVDEVFTGATGAAYFGREFSHAYLRNAALMPEPLRCTDVYSALGDVGAAAGPIAVVRAIASLAHNHTVLVHASSDTGAVGACLLARP